MANGDIAAGAGMDTVASTDDRRLGFDEINKTRDYIVTQKPTWSNITGKPATFTPTVGSTATTAKPGNWFPKWAEITSRPTTFPPSSHTHTIANVTGLQGALDARAPIGSLGGRAVMSVNTSNQMGLRWNGSRPVIRVDGNEWELARIGDIPAGSPIVYAPGDPGAARYAEGPNGTAYGREAGASRYAVWMDGGNQFGRAVSSIRYKDDVKDIEIDPTNVLALRPVTFHYKHDPEGVRDFGLIAEEVNALVPELSVFFNDQVDGVRYEMLSVALLSVVKQQNERLGALETRIEAAGI